MTRVKNMKQFNHEARAHCARAESIFIFLDSQGAQAKAARRKKSPFMAHGSKNFDSLGAQAKGANEFRLMGQGARCKKSGNDKPHKIQ